MGTYHWEMRRERCMNWREEGAVDSIKAKHLSHYSFQQHCSSFHRAQIVSGLLLPISGAQSSIKGPEFGLPLQPQPFHQGYQPPP